MLRAEQARIEHQRDAREQVEQERLRIAREVHDVLAHSVSAISIQSVVGLEALPDEPDNAAAALQQYPAGQYLGAGRTAQRGRRAPRPGRPPAEGCGRAGRRTGRSRSDGRHRRRQRAAGHRGAARPGSEWPLDGRPRPDDGKAAVCRWWSTPPRTASCRSRSPMCCGIRRPPRQSSKSITGQRQIRLRISNHRSGQAVRRAPAQIRTREG